MSRYELKAKPDTPRVVRAVVGWDRPLQTYFAQVFTLDDDDEEEATIWEGTSLRELPTADDALALVSPHAIVPDDLLARLEADEAGSRSQTDGPFQLGMKKLIFRSGAND